MLKALIHTGFAVLLGAFFVIASPDSAKADPPPATIGAYQNPPPAPNGWDTIGWLVWMTQGGYQINMYVWGSSGSESNPAQTKLVFSDNVPTGEEEMQMSYESLYETTVYGKPLSSAMYYKYRMYNVRTTSPIRTETAFTSVMMWPTGSQ